MSEPMPKGGELDVTKFLIERLAEAEGKAKAGGWHEPAKWLKELRWQVEERRAKGIKTYGQSLMTWNGRDPLNDAIEEQLDLFQYLTQSRLERADLIRQLADANQFHSKFRDALARWGCPSGVDSLGWLDDKLKPKPEIFFYSPTAPNQRLSEVEALKADLKDLQERYMQRGEVLNGEAQIKEKLRQEVELYKERAASACSQAEHAIAQRSAAGRHVRAAIGVISLIATDLGTVSAATGLLEQALRDLP